MKFTTITTHVDEDGVVIEKDQLKHYSIIKQLNKNVEVHEQHTYIRRTVLVRSTGQLELELNY